MAVARLSNPLGSIGATRTRVAHGARNVLCVEEGKVGDGSEVGLPANGGGGLVERPTGIRKVRL